MSGVDSIVLVATVNDNRLIELSLESAGYHLQMVTSGEEALAYLREHTPAIMIIDAHLMDLRGTILCDRVKRVTRLKHIPIILLVNAHDLRMIEDARISRADELITKPFMGRRLRSTVTFLLQRGVPKDGESEGEQPPKS